MAVSLYQKLKTLINGRYGHKLFGGRSRLRYEALSSGSLWAVAPPLCVAIGLLSSSLIKCVRNTSSIRSPFTLFCPSWARQSNPNLAKL